MLTKQAAPRLLDRLQKQKLLAHLKALEKETIAILRAKYLEGARKTDEAVVEARCQLRDIAMQKCLVKSNFTQIYCEASNVRKGFYSYTCTYGLQTMCKSLFPELTERQLTVGILFSALTAVRKLYSKIIANQVPHSNANNKGKF